MRIDLFHGLLPVEPRAALKDVFAGLTLSSMNIPQVLGYTRIAQTPVITGLYTALLLVVAFAIFGSSRHLVVAADSATAAIFSSSLSHMAGPASVGIWRWSAWSRCLAQGSSPLRAFSNWDSSPIFFLAPR
jgi:MFS superfamily sulfate permease-like transporter